MKDKLVSNFINELFSNIGIAKHIDDAIGQYNNHSLMKLETNLSLLQSKTFKIS